MSGEGKVPAYPTGFRRFIGSLARVGLDIRPAGRRFRDAVTRPHRAETAVRLARIEAAQHKLSLDVVDLNRQLEAHAEMLAESRKSADAYFAVAVEQHNALAHVVAGMNLRLQALPDIKYGLESITKSSRDNDAARSGDIAAIRALADAERGSWRARVFRVERLLTQAADRRHPVASGPGPVVSVILPTFNRAAFIGEAIASVQAQSFRDWELIVVDDGSTDATAAAVSPYLADHRICFVSQPHSGTAAARNHGISKTHASLIAYLDSDNIWYPDFLAHAAAGLLSDPDVDLVYGALITDNHELDDSCILWQPFIRSDLISGNFIDINTVLHRRSLVHRWGGWDESRRRLLDWELLLRYTSEKPAKPVSVCAARYRRCDDLRISDTVAIEPEDVAIRARWFPPDVTARRPRVLYVVWHYPQLSESYIETELLCMLGWGVPVEVWCTAPGVSRYPVVVPVHQNTLAEAIAAARPDLIHVHWLSFGLANAGALAASGLPVTLRSHGFDTTPDGLAAWLAYDWVKGVFAYPAQIAQSGLSDPRLIPMPAAFETALFKPRTNQDRRMVVRTSAALPSKNLELFLEAARRLPEYRFVLAAVTCHKREAYADELKATLKQMQSPVELKFDATRAEIVKLVGEGALYLHTMHPPGAASSTAVGEPISITEAMATGAYCLVQNVPELAAMVDGAGATYDTVEDLVSTIRATQNWSEEDWHGAQRRSVSRAWGRHADTMVYRPLFQEWMALLMSHPQQRR